MSPRRSRAALTASPVLVGAVTVLVTIVAVFLSYNANTGLPVRAHLRPEGEPAERLAAGRGLRRPHRRRARGPGLEDRAEAARRRHDLRPDHDEARQGDRAAAGRLHPARAAALGARPQVPPGRARAAARPASRPAPRSRSARRGPRSSRSTTSSTCSTTRRASARATRSTATAAGFAGRGRDLNTAIDELRPLLDDLEPVATNLAEPADAARPLLQGARRHGHRGGAGGRGAGLAVREPGHHLHGARLDRAAVPPGVDLRGPAERGGRDPRVPEAAPVPAQQRRLLPRAAAGRGHAAALGADPGRRLRGRHRDAAQDTDDERGPRRRVRDAGGLLRGPAGARWRGPAHAAVLLAATRRCASSRRSRPPATT